MGHNTEGNMPDKNTNSFNLTWLPKKTFEVLATVSWAEIEKAQKQALTKAGETMEIKGFRKGKAPDNLVAESLSQSKLLELTLEEIIPNVYSQAMASLGVKPIISPKIELVSAKEKEDWQVKFTSCEEPEVKLGNYKEEFKKQKTADSIWTPGKGTKADKKEETPQDLATKKDEKIDKAIKYLLENIKVEVGDPLLESEVNRKLAELLEQTQRLGLTIDQYLASTGKTIESLKQEYKTQAEKTLSFQFILNAIAEAEKITVTPEEIDKAITAAKDDNEKKALESQKYLLASMLRQQKTLDFLSNL